MSETLSIAISHGLSEKALEDFQKHLFNLLLRPYSSFKNLVWYVIMTIEV